MAERSLTLKALVTVSHDTVGARGVVKHAVVKNIVVLARDLIRLDDGTGHRRVASRSLEVCLLVTIVLGRVDNQSGVLPILVYGPVKDVVTPEGLADEEVAEHLAKVRVVRLVVEPERARVVQIHGELGGETTAEHFNWSGHLLLHNEIVLLLLGSSLQVLLGQRATAKVEHHVAERLHIVAA